MFSTLSEMLNNPIPLIDDTVIAENEAVKPKRMPWKKAVKEAKDVAIEVVVPKNDPVVMAPKPIAPGIKPPPSFLAKGSEAGELLRTGGHGDKDFDEVTEIYDELYRLRILERDVKAERAANGGNAASEELLALRLFKAKIDAQNTKKKARVIARDIAKKAGTFVSKNKNIKQKMMEAKEKADEEEAKAKAKADEEEVDSDDASEEE